MVLAQDDERFGEGRGFWKIVRDNPRIFVEEKTLWASATDSMKQIVKVPKNKFDEDDTVLFNSFISSSGLRPKVSCTPILMWLSSQSVAHFFRKCATLWDESHIVISL